MKKRLILVMALIAFAFLFWYFQGGPEKIRQQKTAEQLRAAANAVDPEEQIRLYTRVIESDPKSAEAYFNRGYTYGQMGDLDKAIADCTKAIELNPQCAGAYNNRGLAFFLKKDYEKAWSDVKKCQALGGQVSPDLLKALRQASGRDE